MDTYIRAWMIGRNGMLDSRANRHSSRHREGILQSRNGRREEILSSLGDYPLGGQSKRDGLSLGIRTDDGARDGVRSLTDDSVESRNWNLSLAEGEASIISPG